MECRETKERQKEGKTERKEEGALWQKRRGSSRNGEGGTDFGICIATTLLRRERSEERKGRRKGEAGAISSTLSSRPPSIGRRRGGAGHYPGASLPAAAAAALWLDCFLFFSPTSRLRTHSQRCRFLELAIPTRSTPLSLDPYCVFVFFDRSV